MGLVVSARKVPGSKGEEGGIAWTDLLRKGLEKGLDKFLGAHELPGKMRTTSSHTPVEVYHIFVCTDDVEMPMRWKYLANR
jgi:hypothetical protein